MGDDGATTEPDLELLLLGSTEVRLVGEPIEIGAKKLRVLLALLGAAGAEGVSTDALIEDVWEEDPPSGARATLHAYVSNVRRLLGATAIVTTSVGYRLGQHVHCDLHEFDRLRGFRSHPVDLAAAQRLWRGEFAADARPHLVLDAVATRLAEARTEVRIANAAAALETGAPGAVVGELRELIDEAPYDETPVALLMRALYRAGRAVEAGRVFQDFRRRLGDDIGVDPSDELVELEIAVLNGELSSETDHTSQLDEPSRSDSVPQPLDNMFVDEDGNAERLGEAIAKNRLVSLLGVGGVGKTRLVQEWLHSGGLSEHTAVFVNLNDFEEHEAQQAVDAIAGTVRRAADRSCLSLVLVLDNCEHLLGAVAAATERILSENARLKVVATSRVRLGLSHEVVMRIDPLSCEAKRNEPSDACRLLSARIEAFGTRAAVSAPRAMEDLVRSLDGIPLAIEMAAYNVNTLGIEAFSSDSPEAFDLMSDTSTMAGGRRRSLDDTISWSWERLSGETQILLRSLSELRGTFDLSTARIVGKAGGVYTDRHLVALAEASLIGSRSSASTSSKGVSQRYVMLDSVRRFVLRKHGDLIDPVPVQRRVVEHFAERAALVAAESRRISTQQWNERVGLDRPNFRLAFALARTHSMWVEGVQIAEAFLWRHHEIERPDVVRTWIDQALEEDLGDRLHAVCRNSAACLAFLKGDYRITEEPTTMAVSVAEELGEGLLLAEALALRAASATYEGRLDIAASMFVRTEQACIDSGHLWGLVFVHAFGGTALRRAQRLDESAARLRQATEIARHLGDDRLEAIALSSLGRTLSLLHDPTAIDSCQEAWGKALRLDDPVTTALAGIALGRLRASNGEDAVAFDLFRSALDAATEMGNRTSESSALEWMGLLLARNGAPAVLASIDGFTRRRRGKMENPPLLADHDTARELAVQDLGAPAYDAVLMAGQFLDMADVIALIDAAAVAAFTP